jgi:hypothetical protein
MHSQATCVGCIQGAAVEHCGGSRSIADVNRRLVSGILGPS